MLTLVVSLSHVWSDSVIRDMIQSQVICSHTCYDSFWMCDETRMSSLSHVWRDSVICDVTQSCVTQLSHTWHNSLFMWLDSDSSVTSEVWWECACIHTHTHAREFLGAPIGCDTRVQGSSIHKESVRERGGRQSERRKERERESEREKLTHTHTHTLTYTHTHSHTYTHTHTPMQKGPTDPTWIYW